MKKVEITTLRGAIATANNIKRNIEQLVSIHNVRMPEKMQYRVDIEKRNTFINVVVGCKDNFMTAATVTEIFEALKRWTDKTDCVYAGISSRQDYNVKYDMWNSYGVVEITVMVKD